MAIAIDTIAAPGSISAGDPTDVSRMGRKTVTMHSNGTATYQLQISLDPANPPASASWQNEGAAFTAAGSLEVTKPCAWVRFNCTAWTNGTPTACVAGERV